MSALNQQQHAPSLVQQQMQQQQTKREAVVYPKGAVVFCVDDQKRQHSVSQRPLAARPAGGNGRRQELM